MKIAIPVEEKSIKSNINGTLGRAPYFLIYSTITKECEFLDNRAVAELGGAGIRAAQIIADIGVRAVITIRCGENAEKLFRNAEVFVYEAKEGNAEENIAYLVDNKLSLLNEFHSSFHGKENKY
jgi:predicted Fe-Mo cluster-binding NifX family protein